FDKNGNILEVDDGGVYRLTAPTDPTRRRWTPLVGNLTVNESLSVAYDSVNHVLFGGSQDNGTPTQTTPDTASGYTDSSSGDGGISQADNVSLPGFSIHYTTSQTRMSRSVYNGSNVANPQPLTADSTVGLMVTGTGKSLRQLEPR